MHLDHPDDSDHLPAGRLRFTGAAYRCPRGRGRAALPGVQRRAAGGAWAAPVLLLDLVRGGAMRTAAATLHADEDERRLRQAVHELEVELAHAQHDGIPFKLQRRIRAKLIHAELELERHLAAAGALAQALREARQLEARGADRREALVEAVRGTLPGFARELKKGDRP